MDIYHCPTCTASIPYRSNDDLLRHGWRWVVWQGESVIVCPECAEEARGLNRDLMEIGSVQQPGRYGSVRNDRAS